MVKLSGVWLVANRDRANIIAVFTMCASSVCRNKFERYSVRLVAALVHPSYPISQPAKKEIFIGGEVIV